MKAESGFLMKIKQSYELSFLILPWSLQMLIMEKIILKTLGDVVAYVHGADGKAMKEVKQGRILLDWEQI